MPSCETLIIGAGPAGLALAACLAARGQGFEIVERGEAVGTSWRNHYRRLHLHTSRDHSALPLLPFPKHYPTFPSREEVVEFLESYQRHFHLEPRFGTEISKLSGGKDGWHAQVEGGEPIDAERVVLATGFNRRPNRPALVGEEAFEGRVIHSKDYRDAQGFEGQKVLVVGAGNTGAELALDLLESGCEVSMCIRSPIHVIPREFLGRPIQESGILLSKLPLKVRDLLTLGVSRLAFGDIREIGLSRPEIGPISQIVKQRRIPLIDIGTIEHIRKGHITVYPRIERLEATRAIFVDGRSAELDAIVLATGYRCGLEDWIESGAELLDDLGYPKPTAGRTTRPGLYTVGYTNASTGWLRQIGIEAPMVADMIVEDRAKS